MKNSHKKTFFFSVFLSISLPILLFFSFLFVVFHSLVYSEETKVTLQIDPGYFRITTIPFTPGMAPLKIERTKNKKKIITQHASFDAPLTIEDARGSSEPWQVSVWVSPFSNNKQTLPNDSLLLSYPAKVVSHTSSGELPRIHNSHFWLLDGATPITIVSENNENPIISTTISFPKDALSLSLYPNRAEKESTDYQSQLTWMFSVGP